MLGLAALKMERYFLWLALEVARRIGNLTAPLNWLDLGLLISSFFLRTAVLMMEMVSDEALWLPDISAWS